MITKEDYIKIGINENLLHESNLPSIAKWNLLKKKVVEKDEESFDLISDNKGNFKMTYENNRLISLQCHNKLTSEDIFDINNSEGIIFTNWENYRYGFIPTI